MALNYKNAWMFTGIGNEVNLSISNASLQLSGLETPISSSGYSQLVCSYNWAHKTQPTIYVPGGAPIYREFPLPMHVQPDSSHEFHEITSFIPEYPFEVVFRAVELMNPTFRFNSVDVLLNRNGLRRLHDFCLGRVQDSFRVNLYLVNSTLIVEMCFVLRGSAQTGFGHNFERAVTRLPPDLLDSSAHHRVLSYKLGGLECAVHSEVDASYDGTDTAGAPGADEPIEKSGGEGVQSLEASLSLMTLDGSARAKAKHVSVSAISRGSGTPQASVAELKSICRKRSGLKKLPQLWFGRTRYLIKGYHKQGLFNRLQVDDCREALVDWENDEANQVALQKMALLLSRLRDIVSMTHGKACVAIYEKGVEKCALRVFASRSERGPLPYSIIDKFWKT